MNLYKVPQLPGKKNKKNKGKNKNSGAFTVGKIILLTFLSLIFIFLLFVYLFLNFYRPSADDGSSNIYDFDPDEFSMGNNSDPESEETEVRPVEDLSKDRNPDCYTFLITGTDVSGGPTDVIMIAMFNVKENTISILNVPRDTYVNTKNYSGRINGVYSKGRSIARSNGITGTELSDAGIEYLKKMIEYTFGIPIQKHILINLDGLKFLVDSIKGVEFDVPLRMYYTDPYQGLYIDLQPGLQHLDGSKAEQVIRFRHGNTGYPDYTSIGYPSEDIGRIKTQQYFMSAVLKKMLNPIDVNNIKNLFTTASKYMVTNMTLADIGWFGAKMTGVKLENIRTHTVPGNWIASVLRYEAYRAETIEIINKYYNPYKKDMPESKFNIYDNDLIGWNGYKPEIDIDGSTMDNLGK